METYLNNRKTLLEVIQLVDLRHEPTEQDIEMYKWILECGFNGIVIATKHDKVKGSQLEKQKNIIREKLEMPDNAPLYTISATDRYGKYEVWDLFNDLFEFNGYDVRIERQGDNDGYEQFDEDLVIDELGNPEEIIESESGQSAVKEIPAEEKPKKKDRARNKPGYKEKVIKKAKKQAKRKRSKK